MANTFTLIASSTVGAGGAASIDFTSIPSTYTDLVLKVSAKDNFGGTGGGDFYLKINGSTANGSNRNLYGGGSTPAAGSNSASTLLGGVLIGNTYTANTFGNAEIYFPNYAGSANKSYSSDSVQENNATLNYMYLTAGLWSQTAAITSISVLPNSSSYSFAQYSTAYLYGVKNA